MVSTEPKDVLKVIYFPEPNAAEERWRQEKYDLLVSRHYPKFDLFRRVCSE